MSFCLPRYWYLKGNFLVIIVSVVIILPLTLMRQLGKKFPGVLMGEQW